MEENNKSIFSKRINKLRENLHYSRKEFCDHVGISLNTLYLYEQGKSQPNLDVLLRLSEYTGASIDWLCGKSNKINDQVHSIADVLSIISTEIARQQLDVEQTVEMIKAELDTMKEPWIKVIELNREEYMTLETCIETLDKMNHDEFPTTFFEEQHQITFMKKEDKETDHSTIDW